MRHNSYCVEGKWTGLTRLELSSRGVKKRQPRDKEDLTCMTVGCEDSAEFLCPLRCSKDRLCSEHSDTSTHQCAGRDVYLVEDCSKDYPVCVELNFGRSRDNVRSAAGADVGSAPSSSVLGRELSIK